MIASVGFGFRPELVGALVNASLSRSYHSFVFKLLEVVR